MIKKDIFHPRIKDYTFSILFFLIFSFFIFFIIRPTLLTLTFLKREETDLKKINQIYDEKILGFSQLQQFLENNRDKLPYLMEAVPDKPNLSKVIDDLDKASSRSGIILKKVDTKEVNLKALRQKKYNTVSFNLESTADFDQLISFLEILLNQRRLKSIEKLIITKDEISSSSGQLQIQMKIKMSHL